MNPQLAPQFAPRSKQILGAPDYPMIPLFPSVLLGTASWIHNEKHVILGVEILGRSDGDELPPASGLCFIPTPIPKMKMKTFMVVVEYAAKHGDASFRMELRHQKNGGPSRGLRTDPEVPLVCSRGQRGRYGFTLNQEHLEQGGMFCSTLVVAPVEMSRLLVSGCWIQIDG